MSSAVIGEQFNALVARAYAVNVRIVELWSKGEQPGEAEFDELDAIALQPGGLLAQTLGAKHVNAAFTSIYSPSATYVELSAGQDKALRRKAKRLVAAHRVSARRRAPAIVVCRPRSESRGPSREAGRSRSRVTRAGPRATDDPPDPDDVEAAFGRLTRAWRGFR